jgi:hypothetical protein|tara:strand:+ start:201 stop:302 length:102 start_codon:yes stop_codon:yes gene_type:complete
MEPLPLDDVIDFLNAKSGTEDDKNVKESVELKL